VPVDFPADHAPSFRRRKAEEVPVYAVGTCTARGLRALLAELGARPGGPAHVVISDLREELVLYVNGRPYLRRELEMPAAALHHAGESPALNRLTAQFM